MAIAKQYLGREGPFLIAGLSGLRDMDAITLSRAQLVKSGGLEAGTGWRLILVGGMVKMVCKALAALFLGGACTCVGGWGWGSESR